MTKPNVVFPIELYLANEDLVFLASKLVNQLFLRHSKGNYGLNKISTGPAPKYRDSTERAP